jgi:hypothetical protein
MKYILITGAREYPSENLITAIELALDEFEPTGTELVHGGARGIDTVISEAYLTMLETFPGFQEDSGVKCFPAEWDKYKYSAGPIRNRQMVKYVSEKQTEGHEVICLAFPLSPRQPHSGTWDCIDAIQHARLNLRVHSAQVAVGKD